MYADGCSLVPLYDAGTHFKRKFQGATRTRKIFYEYRTLIGEQKKVVDFDSYILEAAAGAEMWLLIHHLREDIFGGFELRAAKSDPVASLSLYSYPGYTENWGGNKLILTHLVKRLSEKGVSTPVKIKLSRVRLLWETRPSSYPHLRIPTELSQELILADDLKRNAA